MELFQPYCIFSVWLDAPESINTIVEELIPNKTLRKLEYLSLSSWICCPDFGFRVEAPRPRHFRNQFWEVLTEFTEQNNELLSVKATIDTVPLEPPEKMRIALTTNVFLSTEIMQHKYLEWFTDWSAECGAYFTKFLVMGILLICCSILSKSIRYFWFWTESCPQWIVWCIYCRRRTGPPGSLATTLSYFWNQRQNCGW